MTLTSRAGLILFVAAAAATLPQRTSLAQESDPWAPFRFLIGTWSGEWSGEPGVSTSGTVSFAFDLDNTIIVRKTTVTFAPAPGEKAGLTHEDLMILYREPGDPQVRALYVDREGFVIRYVASFPPNRQSVVFDSDPAGKGPRFRFVCELSKDGVLTIDVLIAPPGRELKSHVKASVRRAA